MKMYLKKNLVIHILITLSVAVIGVAIFVFIKKDTFFGETSVLEEQSNKKYENQIHGFSFKIPEGYTVREADSTILIEDNKSNGVQILMTPIDEDIPVLTEDMIHADIPDMIISDTQTIEIGENRTGLAFKSDNEAFDGASREVWFVWNGFLYQISTYETLDPLLKSIFATWEFS